MAAPVGFLTQYGLNVSEEDLRKQEALKRQASALAGTPQYDDPALTGVHRAFGRLGAGLSMRGWTPDEIEAKRIKARVEGEAEFQQWRKVNPQATQEDTAIKYRQAIARAAMSNDLIDEGAQIILDLEQLQQARQSRELALKGAGLDIKGKELDIDESLVKQARPIYAIDSDDPNRPIGMGVIDPNTKEAVVRQPDGTLQRYSPSEYSTVRPEIRAGRYGQAADVRNKYGYSMTELGKVRDKYRSASELISRSTNVMQSLTEVLATDPKGNVDVMGMAGRIIGGTGRLADNAVQLSRALAEAGGKEWEGAGNELKYVTKEGPLQKEKVLSGKAGYANMMGQMADSIDDVMRKSGLRLKGQQADDMRAAIMQLAVTQLAINEPGGRYTEQDLERALNQVGEYITQPDALFNRWNKKLSETMHDLDILREQIPADLEEIIMEGAGWERPSVEFEKFREFEGVFEPSTNAVPNKAEGVDSEGWMKGPGGVRIRVKPAG